MNVLDSTPFVVYRRAFYKLYRLTHRNEPWVAPAAVRFLTRRLAQSHCLVEWGSGESTIWFGKRVARVRSIESDANWYERVRRRIDEEGLRNIDLRLCAWEPGEFPPGHFRAGEDSPFVRAVDDIEDGTCDWVVVDGVGREACILRALTMLRRGGYLLVDNTNWRPARDWGVPGGWPICLRSRYSATETTIWQKPEIASDEAPGLPPRGEGGRRT